MCSNFCMKSFWILIFGIALLGVEKEKRKITKVYYIPKYAFVFFLVM